MPMHTNRLHYVVLALVTIALLGIWDGMRGVLLPHLMADLSLTPAQVATIFSATALGYCLAALGFGPLSRRLGLKRLCGAGALVCAGALALFLTMRSPAALYVALLLFGAGLTGLDMGTSIPVSVLYGEQQGGVLNLLHGFFGLGALAGPLYGVVLLQLGAGWRVSFLITGVLLAVCALAFQALPAVALPQAPREQGGWMPLLLDPTFRGAFVALSCSVAAEVGMALWLPSFLQQVKGLSEGTGAFYTTLVFAGFTTARIGGTWFVGRLGYVRSVVILAALGAGGVAGLLVLPGSWAWLSLPAGAGIGVVFPTCTALVSIRHPERVNLAYSLLYAGGALFVIMSAPLMGWIGQRGGLLPAMLVPLGCYALIAASILAARPTYTPQPVGHGNI